MLKRAPLARLGASNGSDPLVEFSARLLDGKSFRNIKRLSMKDVSSGECKTVLCCGENTVAAVANDYEWRAGHKGARARLFYDGSRLGEGKTVAESGIGSGASQSRICAVTNSSCSARGRRRLATMSSPASAQPAS